jgi:hypothetical protein
LFDTIQSHNEAERSAGDFLTRNSGATVVPVRVETRA